MRFESEDGNKKKRRCMEDEERCCREDEWFEKRRKCMEEEEQEHVHEFEGSTKLAELEDDPHNHRFAGVSGEAIPFRKSHIHKIWTRTDFFDHFHFIRRFSGPAIYVSKDSDKHVHFVMGMTSENDGHMHEFQFATLIESPLLPPPEMDD